MESVKVAVICHYIVRITDHSSVCKLNAVRRSGRLDHPESSENDTMVLPVLQIQYYPGQAEYVQQNQPNSVSPVVQRIH